MAKVINISGSQITDLGIQKLVDYCQANLSDDYVLVVGCLPFNSDVDAVLIGRNDIYAVECKNWKGNIEGGSYGYWTKDGETISNPLHQTRNNAVALAKWLREKTGLNGELWVKGLLVFTHDQCSVNIVKDRSSNNGVDVIELKQIGEYINNQRNNQKKEVVEKVKEVFKNIDEEVSKMGEYRREIEGSKLKFISEKNRRLIKKITRFLKITIHFLKISTLIWFIAGCGVTILEGVGVAIPKIVSLPLLLGIFVASIFWLMVIIVEYILGKRTVDYDHIWFLIMTGGYKEK